MEQRSIETRGLGEDRQFKPESLARLPDGFQHDDHRGSSNQESAFTFISAQESR
jgi:hypothetical protein